VVYGCDPADERVWLLRAPGFDMKAYPALHIGDGILTLQRVDTNSEKKVTFSGLTGGRDGARRSGPRRGGHRTP
jgi:hypothetical protein